MEIKLDDCILDFYFEHCQIEITGKCNMRCEHCRAWGESKVHIPFQLFKKAIDFATSEAKDNFRLTISGGEPFLHPKLVEMIQYSKEKNIEDIIITTNGSIISLSTLKGLKRVGVKNLAIQISVDSINSQKHDSFRNFNGAFNLSMKAFDLVKKFRLISSLRASISPQTINEVEELVKLAINKGAKRIGIGSIIPSGRGKTNKSLLMNWSQKKQFLESVANCKNRYGSIIEVTTEDPLKFALEDCPWEYGGYNIQDEGFYGGCTAGISGFNVDSKGNITPCAVLFREIVNLNKHSVKDAKRVYVNSKVIKNLFKRNFKGRCKNCRLKRLCGGCRAVADGIKGDYLGEDSTCFYKQN